MKILLLVVVADFCVPSEHLISFDDATNISFTTSLLVSPFLPFISFLFRKMKVLLLASLLLGVAAAQFSLEVDHDAVVTFTATGPVEFASISTPLKNPQGDFFDFGITHVKGGGIDVFYGEQLDDTFDGFKVKLSAGETKSVQVDLAQIYELDADKSYEVKFQQNVAVWDADGSVSLLEATSNAVTVQAGRRSRLLRKEVVTTESSFIQKTRKLVSGKEFNIAYNSCSEEDIAAFEVAIDLALTYLWQSQKCLTTGKWIKDGDTGVSTYSFPKDGNCQYYWDEYFGGEYTEDRIQTVLNFYANAEVTLGKASKTTFALWCQPEQCADAFGALAFVYRNGFNTYLNENKPGCLESDKECNTIYWCDSIYDFYSGFISYVLIHELTHFEFVGGSKDYFYFRTNCNLAAQIVPDITILNACCLATNAVLFNRWA